MSKTRRLIKDTDKAQNLTIEVESSMNLDEMEAVLFSVARVIACHNSEPQEISRKSPLAFQTRLEIEGLPGCHLLARWGIVLGHDQEL